jgi:hypothetical protein
MRLMFQILDTRTNASDGQWRYESSDDDTSMMFQTQMFRTEIVLLNIKRSSTISFLSPLVLVERGRTMYLSILVLNVKVHYLMLHLIHVRVKVSQMIQETEWKKI